MTNDEDVIYVNEIPFDERIPIEQLKGPAKRWFKRKYITRDKDGNPEPLIKRNQGTGKDIAITGAGIGKAISVARNADVIYAMAALPEMIERMKYRRTLPPNTDENGNQEDKNLLSVEIYVLSVCVRGTPYGVKLFVKERVEGGERTRRISKLSYYTHKFIDEEDEDYGD